MELNRTNADPLFFTCNMCPKIFTTKAAIGKHLYAHAVLKTQTQRQREILALIARGQPTVILKDICKAKPIRKVPVCIRLVRTASNWRCIGQRDACELKSPLQLVDQNGGRKRHPESKSGDKIWLNKKEDPTYVPTPEDIRKHMRRATKPNDDQTRGSTTRPKRSCAVGKVPNYVEEDQPQEPKKPRFVNKHKPKPVFPVGLQNLCLWCNKPFKSAVKRIAHENSVHCPPKPLQKALQAKPQQPDSESEAQLSSRHPKLNCSAICLTLFLKNLGLQMKCPVQGAVN